MRLSPTIRTVATLLAAGAATAALAQSPAYTGPGAQGATASRGHYSGPSNIPQMTVQQLLETGRDDQYARLQGRLISYDGDEHYTFDDGTGRITVEIDDDDFPRGQTVSAEQQVELLGELDKEWNKTEFEVERLTVLP